MQHKVNTLVKYKIKPFLENKGNVIKLRDNDKEDIPFKNVKEFLK